MFNTTRTMKGGVLFEGCSGSQKRSAVDNPSVRSVECIKSVPELGLACVRASEERGTRTMRITDVL